MKVRVQSEDTAPSTIYFQEQESLIGRTMTTTEQLAKYIPTLSGMVSTLTKRRLKFRPKLPNTLKETVIEGDYLLTLNKQGIPHRVSRDQIKRLHLPLWSKFDEAIEYYWSES